MKIFATAIIVLVMTSGCAVAARQSAPTAPPPPAWSKPPASPTVPPAVLRLRIAVASSSGLTEGINAVFEGEGLNVVSEKAPHDALFLVGTHDCGPRPSCTISVTILSGLRNIDYVEVVSRPTNEWISRRALPELVNRVLCSGFLAEFAREIDAKRTNKQTAESSVAAASRTQPVPTPARENSASATTTTAFVAGAPQPNAYAVIVGIEKYTGLPTPTGARADAERFADVAKRSLGIPAAHVHLLIDAQGTKGSIEREVEWAKSSVPPGGRIYFYFSGHGAPDASAGASYILPVDGDPKFLPQTALLEAEVMKRLSESKAREVLAIVDSCFSGAGGRSVLPPGARALVRVREDKPAARLAILSASSGAETSGPKSDGSAGLFTDYVIQGLGTGAADLDGDGQVSLQELSDYVRPRVAREAKKDNRDQTPSLVVGQSLGAAGSFIVEWGLPAK